MQIRKPTREIMKDWPSFGVPPSGGSGGSPAEAGTPNPGGTCRKLSHYHIWLIVLTIASLALDAHGQSSSQSATLGLPGLKPDGSVLLPNQWSLRPSGKQIPLGDFPVHIAVHPDGKYAAILHAGYGKHEVLTIDLPSAAVISRYDIGETFYGLAFNSKGTRLYISGAGQESVLAYTFESGWLRRGETLQIRPQKEWGVPAGLAVSKDDTTLYIANLRGHRITAYSLKQRAIQWESWLIPSKTNALGSGVIPPAEFDLAAATKRAEALLDPYDPADPFPYACVLDDARERLYVSLWAQSSVAVIETRSGKIIDRWPAQEHPNEMLLNRSGKLLYVANANRNTVTVFHTSTGKVAETLDSSMRPGSPPGSTPNSLALSPDERTLYVANACNNNVAAFDVSTPGKSRSLGYIPTGWYPTSVRVTRNGGHLLVTAGKGQSSSPNPAGPQPGVPRPAGDIATHIAGLFQGSLGIISLPPAKSAATDWSAFTAQAFRCSPPPAPTTTASPGQPNPIPAAIGGPSPIKYCIYVIKENRTYDQVLGDMPQGNGDPSLCIFPEKVSPNHHQLAREFVLLDNFYVESEVSADGHEWTMGAYATDFVEKFWPLNYGHNKSGKFPYPSEGKFRIAEPSNGYLWDAARAAGVTYRSYGEFVNNGSKPDAPATTRMAALKDHFDPGFRAWDMDYPDVQRAERFLSELRRFEQEGEMPRLQILRLPNDHTYGTSPGKPTPTAMVAENDLALGKLIEGISKSKFWAQTAVFVVEDDAQNGPDHVDAHRTIAYVISPYARRGAVDSTLYSTCSMLRSMELILGIQPMTQFDAAAMPMFNSFQPAPNLRPFTCLPANVSLTEKNLATAWGADESRRMDFSKEDAADDLRLNEVIWRSVRGSDSPMPAPTRAAFVFVHPDED